MTKLNKAIAKKKVLVFLDLEGTQMSHEMIAIGAIKCGINSKGRIKKYYKPFKRYVKAKNKIGGVVEKLTGITEDYLKANAIDFYTAMSDFKKYVGISFKNALFVTFGSHDIRIINQSMQYNFHVPEEICKHIIKNHLDFLMIISEFVKDKDNNPLSLVNYCNLFNVKQSEPAHDPENDAINLAKLYDAFLDRKELVFSEYKKVLAKINHMPKPIKDIMEKLARGEDVTVSFFEESLKQYIDD